MKIPTTPFAAALLALFAALAPFAPLSPAGAAERPNLLVFLVDDMGVMDTSVAFLTDAEGQPERHPLNDYYRTPAMERLAARGIRFNQFYAMSVCSPTRITLVTGQNAARHGTTNWINPDNNNGGPQGAPDWNWEGIKPGDTTLPAVLGGAGYRTIHIGKGHFSPREFPGSDPSTIGFDINIAGASFGAPGSYYGEKNYGAIGRRAHHAVPGLEKYHGTDTFLTEALTLEAKAVLRETVEEGNPFFMHFSHYAVHAPFEADPRFAAYYEDSGKSSAAQAFATLIEGMDKSLGDTLDFLESIGVAEDTLVVFLGDNGSDAPLGDQHEVACAAPLRGKKGAHYEGGMRTPLIAAWAKPNPENPHQRALPIPAGAIQAQVASVADIFPTLLDVAGVEAPQEHPVDGRSLRTLLSGTPDPSRPEQFLMHYPHGPHRSNYFTVWRDGDWKVVYHYLPEVPTHGGGIQSEGARYQLFHLAEDPYEQNDLAESEPAELRRMMEGLVAQAEAHGARFPVAEDGTTRLLPELP